MNEFLNPYLRETNPLSNYYRIQQLLKQIEISTQILTIYLKKYETKPDTFEQEILIPILTESNKITQLLSTLKQMNQSSPDTFPIIISPIENIAKKILYETQNLLIKAKMPQNSSSKKNSAIYS